MVGEGRGGDSASEHLFSHNWPFPPPLQPANSACTSPLGNHDERCRETKEGKLIGKFGCSIALPPPPSLLGTQRNLMPFPPHNQLPHIHTGSPIGGVGENKRAVMQRAKDPTKCHYCATSPGAFIYIIIIIIIINGDQI